MTGWPLVTSIGLALAAAYLAVAAGVLRPLVARRETGRNRLGVASAGIFFTCAVHHASLAVLPLLAAAGVETAAGRGLQVGLTGPQAVLDVTALVAAGAYLVLRRGDAGRTPAGSPLDEPRRRRRAIELNDDVVQGLTVAQMALALGERERSEAAIASTLAAARAMMSDLLGEPGRTGPLAPGDLVRTGAATVEEA